MSSKHMWFEMNNLMLNDIATNTKPTARLLYFHFHVITNMSLIWYLQIYLQGRKNAGCTDQRVFVHVYVSNSISSSLSFFCVSNLSHTHTRCNVLLSIGTCLLSLSLLLFLSLSLSLSHTHTHTPIQIPRNICTHTGRNQQQKYHWLCSS